MENACFNPTINHVRYKHSLSGNMHASSCPRGCDTLLDSPVFVISCANALLKQNTLPNILYQPKQRPGG